MKDFFKKIGHGLFVAGGAVAAMVATSGLAAPVVLVKVGVGAFLAYMFKPARPAKDAE